MATYDYLKSKNGHKIQVESAKRDGAGKNIENNYAKQNGYYAQLTAGLSDNFTPYSEDSGDFQENPFISNGTGTNNNQEIVTVGDYALVQEKKGNSVVVNQLAKELNANNNSIGFWYGVNHTVSYNNNVATLTVTGANSGIDFGTNATISFVQGHKYLIALTIKSSISGRKIRPKLSASQSGQDVTLGTDNNIIQVVSYDIASSTSRFAILIFNSEVNDVFEISDYQIIDLTQWFGSNDNIPADLLANPSHWSWYQNFGDYIAYNTGSLENANGVKLVSTGRNLFDGVLERGSIDTAGRNSTDQHIARIPDFIQVFPNAKLYTQITRTHSRVDIFEYDGNKNFLRRITNVQNNSTQITEVCRYIRFRVSDTTDVTIDIPLDTKVCISLYYTPEQGGEGYDKYYPYEEPTIVDTGTELLLSAGNARDYKTKDGIIHRVVGTVDLGTINWNYRNDNGDGTYTFRADDNSVNYKVVDAIDYLCSKFSSDHRYSSTAGFSANAPVNSIALYFSGSNTDKYIYVKTSTNYADAASFKAAMSGVMLYYELAQETTEQGTPFAEALPINDYGMLYWLDENDNLVGIPQGVKIFFPVNYKGFLDDVYSRTSGDAENLVIQSELSASETARDTVDAQLLNAIGGTLRQCLCVAKSLSFDNTNMVDLGTLSWTYYAGYNGFMAVISDVKKTNTASQEPNMICSKYRTAISYSDYDGSTKSLYTWNNLSGNNIVVRDTSFGTDADAFKNAMKGVLLAYEKA